MRYFCFVNIFSLVREISIFFGAYITSPLWTICRVFVFGVPSNGSPRFLGSSYFVCSNEKFAKERKRSGVLGLRRACSPVCEDRLLSGWTLCGRPNKGSLFLAPPRSAFSFAPPVEVQFQLREFGRIRTARPTSRCYSTVDQVLCAIVIQPCATAPQLCMACTCIDIYTLLSNLSEMR